MREVEFLPEWYPLVLRRRRLIFLQSWLAMLVIAGLGMWLVLAQRNVSAAEAALGSLEQQLSQTDIDLRKLEELRVLQRQWREQDQIFTRLGVLHVESTRLLAAMATLMPEEMSLLEFSVEAVEEQPGAMGSLLAARQQQQATSPQRRMNVRLLGVAPTDMNLASFLARMSDVPFFERVAVAFVRDRMDSGHVMREFEVTFSISLAKRETK